MAHMRITFDGHEYESPEAMPPAVRRAYEDLMREVGPALEDADGNGIPDLVEREGDRAHSGETVVENRIVLNGQVYRSTEEMPPEARKLYEEAMSRVHGGAGLTISREGPRFSIGLSFSPGSSGGVPPTSSRPIEPSGLESSLRTALIVVGGIVVLALAGWALLGR